MQQRDAERENRKHAQSRVRAAAEPLYTLDDALDVLQQVRAVPYGQPVEVLPGVELVFRDAGHILGSASVWLRLREGALERRLTFSGDLGQYDTPILRDPEPGPAGRPGAAWRAPTARACTASGRPRSRNSARILRAARARRRQRADPGLRGRPHPGDPLRARDALRRVGARRLAGVPRQPDGDRGDRRLLAARPSCSTRRRGEWRGARARAAVAAEPEALSHARTSRWRSTASPHGAIVIAGSGMCTGRPHRPPPQAQPRRGPSATWSSAASRPQGTLGRAIVDGRESGAHPRLAGQGRGPRAHARRLLGARRPAGPAALVRRDPGPAAGVAGARRSVGRGGPARCVARQGARAPKSPQPGVVLDLQAAA